MEIKYVLLSDWVSEEEKRELDSWLNLEAREYQIIILPDQMELEDESVVLALGQMEVGNVYIVNAQLFREDVVLRQGYYAGISNVHSGAYSAKAAYREAYMARNYAFFYQIDGLQVGGISAIDKDEVRKRELSKNFPNQPWMELYELVKQKKISYAEFRTKMDRVISDIAANLPPEVEMQREIIVDSCKRPQRFCTILDWMNELNELWENIHFMERLSCIVRDERIWGARKYIRANYQNPYLTAKEVSEAVHMSYSAFSKRFGMQDGISFKEYLRKVRIAHAVECLKDNKATISSVARECGYEDSRVFIENFRKQQRMTPREFQEWYQNQKE